MGAMKVPKTATERLLLWTEGKAPGQAARELKELPSHFSLEGPHLFWRAGSPEVKMAFLGTGGNFLLIGSKWNVVEDYVDLSHLTVSVLGNMVSLSGGQDTVLRIFCPEPESVQTFSEQIRAASYMRVSDEYLKGLQEHIKSRKKADKRRSWASAFGRWTEKICGARSSPTGTQAEAMLKRKPSQRFDGAEASFLGRFYLKSTWTEANGKIHVHGDALILQSLGTDGEVKHFAIPLTGATATTAGFMVSVRRPDGLALLRLWLDSSEEAEELTQRIIATGEASAQLVQRKILPQASTVRRQIGRMAESLCNCTMQVPQGLRAALVPKGGCWERKPKRVIKEEAFVLDGRCSILRAKSEEVHACHAVLRGDALWFGRKAGACDQVMSVVSATVLPCEGMVLIKTRTGDCHRLWPEEPQDAKKWSDAIQVAGQISKDLGKWEANKKSAFYAETAQEKVRTLARGRCFRMAAEWMSSSASRVASLICSERTTATQVLMMWQEASQIPHEITPSTKAYPSVEANFSRRAGVTGKSVPRTLEVRGDVMFVFDQGKMEKPVMLQGANVFVNTDRYNVVSIWLNGEMQARMFIDQAEEAESWGQHLAKGTKVVQNARAQRMEEEVPPLPDTNSQPILSRGNSFRVTTPTKLSEQEHKSSQQLAKSRSRRFVEAPLDQAVGA
ncbi:unnamed protein product [Durusdinium trenchii]|uniref:FACT complex subunit n=1 Tax=Durusdinium trenchii TaxID=1381693 RepID=A0ABP0S3A1_9DINO